jgi:putative endonuclease
MKGGCARRNSAHLVSGRRAEDSALAFLEKNGLRLVDRNFLCRGGEIDLIMLDGIQLVFVEVRFRSNSRFGSAAESVDRRKQARITHAASWYMLSKRLDCPARFDVVAVSPGDEELKMDWIPDAFQGGGA